jgi:predicted MFS family arabinose efflux permease
MRVLRQRDFRLLYFGQTISLLGDGLFMVALAFAVLEATGSKTGLGLVFAAGALPLVAFTLIGGVWADRLPRRRILIAADLARVAIQTALAILVVSGHALLWQFALLAALYNTASAFFFPAATGFLPELLADDELQEANGLSQITRSVTQILGGAVGGLVVAGIGPGAAIGADALTFVASALALVAIRPTVRVAAAADAVKTSFVHELHEGWREVRSRRWLWMTIVIFSLLLTLYVAPLQIVGPIVAQRDLGGAIAWGLIGSSFAVGSVIGGVVAMRGWLRYPMAVCGGLLLMTSVTPLLLAGPAPLPLILLTIAVEGVAIGILHPVWMTALQVQIPGDMISRVSAWDMVGSIAGMPLGFALTGPVIAIVGTDGLLYGMAVCGASLATCLLLNGDVRRLGARAA